MKIILINGTAAGYGQGTEKITEIIKKTFAELEVKVDEINLASLKLPYYDGTTYPSIEKLLNEIRNSEGVIFACSALKFSPSAVMQTFIEHLDPALYGNFLEGKHCFTVVSSYDGSEYYADEYLSRVLRSVGADASIRLAAGREYAQRISYDSTVIDIIEKNSEDFYRTVKRNTPFIVPEMGYNMPEQPVMPNNAGNYDNRENNTGFTPVPDNYRNNSKNYKEDKRYTNNGSFESERQYSGYSQQNSSAQHENRNNDAAYGNGNNGYAHQNDSSRYAHQNSNAAYDGSNNAYTHKNNDAAYDGSYNQHNYGSQEYNKPSYDYNTRDYNGSEQNYGSQNYNAYSDPYSGSGISYSGFDKQQEEDINELTRLLANEYNKENTGYRGKADNQEYLGNKENTGYSRSKSVSDLYKNNFTPMSENNVVPHVKSCRQKTQSLYHHFRPQYAKGIEAAIQINVTGREIFSACLTISNGECTYSEGVHPSPTVTIFADTDAWNDVLDGKVTSQKSFMVGQIKVKGNFGILSKFDQCFKMN